MMRTAEVKRVTKETQIVCEICLDGSGKSQISTGIGFFDHMLTSFAFHSGFDLKLSVKGDLEVDCHHTVEDTGIVLGQAVLKALGDRKGIERFASSFIPMDEALAFSSVDVSGRPFLVYDVAETQSRCGEYDVCMTEEFFRAFAVQTGITLHIRLLYGKNAHHITEAVYKSVARSLRQAFQITGSEVPSSKGML